MTEAFKVVRRGRTDAQLIADHIEREAMEALRDQRLREFNRRFCLLAGTIAIGAGLAYILPVIGGRVHEFVGAAIEAFWNSPLGPF